MFAKRALQPAVTTLIPVRTRRLIPPQDDLWDALGPALPSLKEGDVLVITSKIVAIHQGRCVPMASVKDREDLVETEAEAWLPRASSRYGITLSIKGGTLVAGAGIDVSNANDHFVLWPSAPTDAAAEIGRRLKQEHRLHNLGVVLTDSHCTCSAWASRLMIRSRHSVKHARGHGSRTACALDRDPEPSGRPARRTISSASLWPGAGVAGTVVMLWCDLCRYGRNPAMERGKKPIVTVSRHLVR